MLLTLKLINKKILKLLFTFIYLYFTKFIKYFFIYIQRLYNLEVNILLLKFSTLKFQFIKQHLTLSVEASRK